MASIRYGDHVYNSSDGEYVIDCMNCDNSSYIIYKNFVFDASNQIGDIYTVNSHYKSGQSISISPNFKFTKGLISFSITPNTLSIDNSGNITGIMSNEIPSVKMVYYDQEFNYKFNTTISVKKDVFLLDNIF